MSKFVKFGILLLLGACVSAPQNGNNTNNGNGNDSNHVPAIDDTLTQVGSIAGMTQYQRKLTRNYITYTEEFDINLYISPIIAGDISFIDTSVQKNNGEMTLSDGEKINLENEIVKKTAKEGFLKKSTKFNLVFNSDSSSVAVDKSAYTMLYVFIPRDPKTWTSQLINGTGIWKTNVTGVSKDYYIVKETADKLSMISVRKLPSPIDTFAILYPTISQAETEGRVDIYIKK